MSKQLYLLLGLLVALYIYYNYYTNDELEPFLSQCDTNSSLWKRSLQLEFSQSPNINCLADIGHPDCKDTSDQSLDINKLYPMHIIKTNDDSYLAVFNDGKLYLTDDIEKENLWRGPLNNSLPKRNIHLLMITFDRTGILMGIGSNHQIYVKTRNDLESPWNTSSVPNSDCVTYIMFDKDNKLLGLDMNGNIIKKKKEDIKSKWEKPSENNKIPLLKMYWDVNGHMLGLGANFKLYQKVMPTWEVSKWKAKTTEEQLADIIYDKDGRLYGIVLDKQNDMIEIKKQNQAYYTSAFYPLVDTEVQGVSVMNLGQIIQSKMGSRFMTEDEHKQDENTIVDPSLEEIRQKYNLDNQKKLRSLCASKKKIYNSSDYYDFELQRKIEDQDKLINNLNKELDKYAKVDKKYLNLQEKDSIKSIDNLIN